MVPQVLRSTISTPSCKLSWWREKRGLLFIKSRLFHWNCTSSLNIRPRVWIGLAGLGPKVVCSAGHHGVFSVQVKTRRYSQGNYWYQTEVTLDTAQHCWCGSTNVGRFLFTRAFMLVDGNVTRRLAVYSFHLRHPLFFFFFPWNFNSSLLFLKFSIHQSTYY